MSVDTKLRSLLSQLLALSRIRFSHRGCTADPGAAHWIDLSMKMLVHSSSSQSDAVSDQPRHGRGHVRVASCTSVFSAGLWAVTGNAAASLQPTAALIVCISGYIGGFTAAYRSPYGLY
jgi:hypothetical protein